MALNLRSLWARTNHAYDAPGLGLKINKPDGWMSEEPFYWYGSDSVAAYKGYDASGYAAITKATSIIVNRLATSVWSVGDSTPRWIADPMLCRPDRRVLVSSPWPMSLRLPGPYFWGQWIRSALLYGMGYMIFIEDELGQPVAGSMYNLRPGAVRVDGASREIVTEYGDNIPVEFDNTFVNDNGRVRWRLLELRNPTTPIDPSSGVSVGTLQHHAVELGLVASIASYEAGTFTGGGVPSGYLKVNMPQVNQEQADTLKANWMKAHGSGRRSVAVLNSTIDYHPIAVSPVDAELAEMKRLSLVDVANAFCVPLFMLGAPPGHSNVYSNVATEQQALWVHTLQPWAKAIEMTVSALLPVGTELNIALPAVSGKAEGASSQPASSMAGEAGEVVQGNTKADNDVNEVIA